MLMMIKLRPLEIDQNLKQLVRCVVSMNRLFFIGDLYKSSVLLFHQLLNALKKKKFDYGDKAEKNFALIKKSLSIASILTLSNFIMLFEVESDACI
jgi:hypothetical protein